MDFRCRGWASRRYIVPNFTRGHCHIEIAELPTAPKYSTLSCSWGDPAIMAGVQLDGISRILGECNGMHGLRAVTRLVAKRRYRIVHIHRVGWRLGRLSLLHCTSFQLPTVKPGVASKVGHNQGGGL
jgi:hypothetical protein